jgi:phosphatidate cytidylyltransferase
VLALVLGVLAQIGDLCESAVKRAWGAKDSGRLFPGHGGLLDRADSLLFPAACIYYYGVLWA